MTSRTLTRAFIVSSVLLFALEGRLTQGVRTAYESGWTGPAGCTGCRLPTEGWVWAHTLATVLLIVCLVGALTLWWKRRRRQLSEATLAASSETHAPLLRWAMGLGSAALAASLAAAVLTYLADHEDHRGFVALGSGLELAALLLVAAAGFLLARTSRSSAESMSTGDVVIWTRSFLQRQRVTLIAVSFLVSVLIVVGQTSGQAVDSMRVWTDFGDDRSLARLSFGIASCLLLALVIYEGGIRLSRVELDGARAESVRARWWFVAGAGVALCWVILYFSLHRSLGFGLLVCACILLALGVLELGRAEGRVVRLPADSAHEGAVEVLAIVPLLVFALVAVFAAVDSGLAGGSGWEALRVFSPGALLAALAVLMTSETRYETSQRPWWIWLTGAVVFLVAIGLLIWFHLEGWGITSVVGFSLSVLAAGYAVAVFRWRRRPLGPLGGWRLSLPVALASGLATFLLLHVDPEGFGQTLGSFALVNLSLAFVLAWLPWVIGWSLRRRPPRVLWALGLQQLPLVSLVLAAWILAGIVKPPASLHDVRLVDHGSDLARPTLDEVFQSWMDAQAELEDPRPGPPVPLVLVANHGGGIKAAYWTALVLDCVVGVSPSGFDGTAAEEADPRTCTTERRTTAAQQQAARRIFLLSSVSGGAMGAFAYARQLLAEGSLGSETDDSDDSWVKRRLARDFVSPTVGWALFHDIPNHILGLHPRERGVCAWHFFDPCATVDRGTVLERSFDNAFGDAAGGDPTLRGTWEARSSDERAETVPLIVGNATVTGGQARAVISAADLAEWPSLEGSAPPGGDPRPLAGTVEVGDTLCSSNDLRLSTASLLAGHFPYVSASAHLEALCGSRDGKVLGRDEQSNCARIDDPSICELNLVDGGYAENSGLFTIVALWPALHRLVVKHNATSPRKIALVIVEIDNHYRPRVRDVPRGSKGKSETLIPPATAFGAHNAAETFARGAAQRVTGPGCTLTISPRLHPGLVAPLGWELSEGARDDLRRGLVEPRPNATGEQRLAPVLDLRRLQAWLGGEEVEGLDTRLTSCVPF